MPEPDCIWQEQRTALTMITPADAIVIACSTDEHYAPGLAAMMRSLLDHYKGRRPIRLNVLQSDLSRETQRHLLDSWKDDRLSVDFLRPELAHFAHLPCFNDVHPAMYYYLALPELLPGIAKILKMDADMLVFDDIRNLWDIDLGSHPTAAARELLSPYVSSARGLQNFKALGIPPLTPYCNAGLQLINLDVWRNEGIAEKIIEHTRKYETVIRYWDQDGVNAVLAGRWMELDPVWNVEIEALMLTGWIPEDARRAKDIIDHTKILHFVVQKPWKKHCLHPRAALFLAYLEKTQWKDLALSLSRQ